MQPQSNSHSRTSLPEARRPEAGSSGLECLRCRHVFDIAEFGRIREAGRERTYIQCAWCDALNEVRSVPHPGLGAQPTAVVVRILDASGNAL